MPTTIQKIALTGSTGGQGVLVSATAGTTNTIIHSITASVTTTVDEVYLYANNNTSQDVTLFLELGVSTTQLQLKVDIPPQIGQVLVLTGNILVGNATPREILAFASNSLAISMYGWVNRISQT